MLSNIPLFHNTTLDISRFLIKEFKPGTVIHQEDDICIEIGIIITGSVEIKSYTYSGFDFLITRITEGMLFGENLLYSSNDSYLGSIIAVTNTKILYIQKNTFINLLNNNQQLLKNYLHIQSNKMLKANQRLKIISQPTLREKILLYFKDEQHIQSKNTITIPMNREQLARFLCTQRPSLSRELSKLKQEGIIIDYHKNTIQLK